MKHWTWIVGLTILSAACGTPSPGLQVVDDTAEALGGRARVEAVRTLVLEGEGEQPNIGQNMAPDADLPVWTVTQYKRTLDLENGRMRVQATRVPAFPFPVAEQRQDFGVDGEVAYTVNANGMAARNSEQLVWDRRVELLHHPIAVVRAALADGARVSNLNARRIQ